MILTAYFKRRLETTRDCDSMSEVFDHVGYKVENTNTLFEKNSLLFI